MAWSWMNPLSTIFYRNTDLDIEGVSYLVDLRVNLYIYQYQVAMLDIVQIRLHECEVF